MIAIGLLFVRMLCDCFKSRRRLEAEILVVADDAVRYEPSPHPNSLLTGNLTGKFADLGLSKHF
jgi:hypothetical protein